MPTKNGRQDIVDLVRAINERESNRYLEDEPQRERYFADHPTFVSYFGCMDGRVGFANITDTPTGIVEPFQAIGGKFEAWWPALSQRVRTTVKRAMRHGAYNLFLVTYHYSDSEEQLGCAGWHHDTVSAKRHAERFARDLAEPFGEQAVVIVGDIETDSDILTLHGAEGSLNGRNFDSCNASDAIGMIHRAFPAIPEDVAKDIVPCMLGNARRIKQLVSCPRTHLERRHGERIVAVGQGFGWLNEGNLALIVNDMDPNLDEAIITAAKIVHGNTLVSPNGNVALCSNVSYYKPGMDRRQAVVRARGLLRFAREHIEQRCPELLRTQQFRMLTGVTFEPSKRYEIIFE